MIKQSSLGSRAAAGLLATFVLVATWLAIAPAVRNSHLVLATVGGSPDWLIGVWRFGGVQALAGGNAGWIYYAVLMAAMLIYAALVALAPRLSLRLLVGTIVGLHVIFFLAPPLLSQDVFSYIAYARLGGLHGLNPYSHRPFDIPLDPVFPFAGSKDAVNVYGPFFSLLIYPLKWVSVPVGFWLLKAVAAVSSIGLVVLVGHLADRVGANRKRAVVLLGLCPATLVHVVGGAHNEALTMLLLMAGVSVAIGRPDAAGDQRGANQRWGGFVSGLASGIKASAVVPLPFMLVAARDKLGMLIGFIVAGAVTLATALIAFGPAALNGLNLLSSNQARTSRFSLPHVAVNGLDLVFGGINRAAAADTVRAIFLLILVAVVAWLLWRSWKQPTTWLANAGWATLGVLLATAWLVPWYLLWLLPFAALSRSRALIVCSVIFAGYTMAIAIPF